MMGKVLFDKIWSEHALAEMDGGVTLLHIDRHLIHDLEGAPGLARIAERGYSVHNPELTFAMPDHAIASDPGRHTDTNPIGGRLLRELRQRAFAAGIRLYDLGGGQGIVHVVAPELGLTLPGLTIVCGDSHTCTHGGLGALAFGIGSSEVAHVLATQTLRQKKPQVMRLHFEGQRHAGVTAKDMILHAIGRFGTAAGRGYAVEYAGSAVRALDIESRLTLCNLSIELGAKIGLIAPDDTTFEYLSDRPLAPKGALFDAAVHHWRTLSSDPGAQFDVEHSVDVAQIAPQITWGTSPQDVVAIDGHVPDPDREPDTQRRKAMQASLQYMGLTPGRPLEGTPIDWVFIGSCANGRLSDLRQAAKIAAGRKVAPHVRAWVVPGSEAVKRAAEAEGLVDVFRQAGFEWREPSCSLCLAANGDAVPPQQRCVATSNRNFVGRQGVGARTHLASPAMAAAAAVTGSIADVRKLRA
jgi:3-isopropylmalate/(R)-2-methylmalate dehydratase large subunit